MPNDFDIRFSAISYEQDHGYKWAVLDFAIDREQFHIVVPVRIDANNVDDADFVRQARAGLHGILKELAEETKHWALEQPEAET